MLKAAIKHSTDADKVRHRTLPSEQVALWAAKLDEIKDEITAVMKEEKEEKAVRRHITADGRDLAQCCLFSVTSSGDGD
jgi:hypothetical protein